MSKTKDMKRAQRVSTTPPAIQSQTREVQVQPPPRPKFSLVLTYDPGTDRAGLSLLDQDNPPQKGDVGRALLLLRDRVIGELAISMYQQEQQPESKEPEKE